MDLNLSTIANRANLSEKINIAFKTANDSIIQLDNITNKINNLNQFDENEKLQNRKFAIIGLVSITELLLTDILHKVIISYPKKFGEKKFDIDELTKEGSILELFYKKATEKVLNLAYGKFDNFMIKFAETLELTNKIDNDLVQIINEIKCTRDCLIHSDGKSNELYLSKAKNKTRVDKIDIKLKIDIDYYQYSIVNIKKFLSDIKSNLPEKILNENKVYIFKQMWEATCLNRCYKFDEVWKIENSIIGNQKIVRPVNINEEYGFSSSEEVVYNLFKHIFRDSFKVDFPLYFKRWEPQSNEYQIATSWLNNQFYF